jgi:hypothetical protein
MLDKKFKVQLVLSSVLILSMAVPTAFAVANWVETEYKPVMAWFDIQEVKHVHGGRVLSGELYKLRDCETKGMTAYSSGRTLLSIEFLKDPPGTPIKTRATGRQPFDGIKIMPDMPLTELNVRHRCHMFWDVATNLLALPARPHEIP